MNKYVLLGIFVLIFVVGVGVIFTNEHVSFSEAMRGLSNLSPRVMSLLALPLIAILFGIGYYFHKKSEERMWKAALKQTRAKSNTRKNDDA